MAGLSSKARRSLIFGASAVAGLFAKMASGAVPQAAAAATGDMLSVRSFGLKGDGTSGNGAALNAMLTSLAGGTHEVLVAKGDYLVDAGLTIGTNVRLRFEAGARFVVPAGVTLTLDEAELLAGRQQIFRCVGNGRVAGNIRNDLIFPEWWGAVADGLHPNKGRDFSERAAAAARNARALQAALNFAGGQYPVNGLTGTVSLTYGYYAYDTTLSIPLSVNVVGYGIGSALFFYSATGNAVESVNTNNSMLKDFFIAPLAGPTWNRTNGYGLYMKGVSTPSWITCGRPGSAAGRSTSRTSSKGACAVSFPTMRTDPRSRSAASDGGPCCRTASPRARRTAPASTSAATTGT